MILNELINFSNCYQRIIGGFCFFEGFNYDLVVYIYWLRAIFDAIKYQTVISAVVVDCVYFDIISLEY
jgi:hypothetical protein